MVNQPVYTPHQTVIVVHPKENRKKCSVEPLRSDARFLFWKYPEYDETKLSLPLRLGVDGPPLTRKDGGHQLLVLDGTWRYAATMEEDYANIQARSLQGWVTAYPRTSKIFDDPLGGLATIEAIYAAFLILGKSTAGLLEQYFWKDEFLRLNQELIASYVDSAP